MFVLLRRLSSLSPQAVETAPLTTLMNATRQQRHTLPKTDPADLRARHESLFVLKVQRRSLWGRSSAIGGSPRRRRSFAWATGRACLRSLHHQSIELRGREGSSLTAYKEAARLLSACSSPHAPKPTSAAPPSDAPAQPPFSPHNINMSISETVLVAGAFLLLA